MPEPGPQPVRGAGGDGAGGAHVLGFAGLVADLTSVRASILSGGVLCVVGVGGTAVWLDDFWRYDARTDEHAVREREVRAAQGRQ